VRCANAYYLHYFWPVTTMAVGGPSMELFDCIVSPEWAVAAAGVKTTLLEVRDSFGMLRLPVKHPVQGIHGEVPLPPPVAGLSGTS
jgi:hypothetical protein